MHITSNLDEDTIALLKKLAAHTGLTSVEIIHRLLSGQISELHELDAFLELHAKNTTLHDAGVNLLMSYGPENISSGLKRIAPAHELLDERFKCEMADAMPLEWRF